MSKKLHDPGARLIETSYCPTTCFCYFAVLSNCSCCAGVSCRLGSYRHPTFLQLVLLFVFTQVFSLCLVSPAVPVNRGGQTPMDILQSYNTSTMSTRLQITAPIGLTQGYLTRLFSLIPGLEYCDLNETTGKLLNDLYPWIFILNERHSVESLSLYS